MQTVMVQYKSNFIMLCVLSSLLFLPCLPKCPTSVCCPVLPKTKLHVLKKIQLKPNLRYSIVYQTAAKLFVITKSLTALYHWKWASEKKYFGCKIDNIEVIFGNIHNVKSSLITAVVDLLFKGFIFLSKWLLCRIPSQLLKNYICEEPH